MANGKYVSKIILLTSHEWSLIKKVAAAHDNMTELDAIHKALRRGLEIEVSSIDALLNSFEQISSYESKD